MKHFEKKNIETIAKRMFYISVCVPDYGLKCVLFIYTKHKRKCAICRFVEHICTAWCRPPRRPQGSVFPLWRNPGPLANVPPCQRQRGFKTAGLGRLHHLQAIFQAIHLSRIIERPILSTPGGVTSYHKPPAPLLIKRGWEDQVEENS